MTQVCKSKIRSPLRALKVRSPLDGLLEPEFFQALSDDTRLSLLCCLSKCARACSLTELAECCHVDLSVVSRHMNILCRARIVKKTRSGRNVLYQTDLQTVANRFNQTAQAFQDCCSGSSGATKVGCCG